MFYQTTRKATKTEEMQVTAAKGPKERILGGISDFQYTILNILWEFHTYTQYILYPYPSTSSTPHRTQHHICPHILVPFFFQ